jgi:hypothetical protein
MGFLNKPGKATRGAINKVVREIDRVCMTGNQFQREYGTPQPQLQPLPPSILEIDPDIGNEVDPEFPQYFKRNKIGLMIPLPEYYPEYKMSFIITERDRDIFTVAYNKEVLNNQVFATFLPIKNGEYPPWNEYVVMLMVLLKNGYLKDHFNDILQYYP